MEKIVTFAELVKIAEERGWTLVNHEKAQADWIKEFPHSAHSLWLANRKMGPIDVETLDEQKFHAILLADHEAWLKSTERWQKIQIGFVAVLVACITAGFAYLGSILVSLEDQFGILLGKLMFAFVLYVLIMTGLIITAPHWLDRRWWERWIHNAKRLWRGW